MQSATARLGAILVNLKPAYKAAELEYELRKAGVSLLVMSRGFRGADYVAILARVRADSPSCARSSYSRTTGTHSWPRARAATSEP